MISDTGVITLNIYVTFRMIIFSFLNIITILSFINYKLDVLIVLIVLKNVSLKFDL